MKTTLFKILWKKEKRHWKRMSDLLKKFNGIFSRYTVGLSILVLLTVVNYAFAFMSTLYHTILFIFARRMFKNNLQTMMLKL